MDAGTASLGADGAKIIARIGPEVVLASEVASAVNEVIAENAAKIPPDQVDAVRDKLTRDRLNSLIEIKLALVDARRKIPEAGLPKIMENIGEEFETKELKRRLRQMNLAGRGEYDARLRQMGSSLEREKRAWVEQQLAFGWIHQQLKTKKEISHQEMLDYYQQHLSDYEFPAKARWEQLQVRVANFPTRAAAQQALSAMGNDVLRGVPLAEVAKARSQGSTAADGGQFDWTSQGSLASRQIDAALFSLPIGRLSRIIEEDRSLSIVRVLERKDAGRSTFDEVHDEIKQKIEEDRQEKSRDQVKDYLAKLRADTPVWTIFDDAPAPAETGLARRTRRPGAAPPGGPNTSLRPTAPAANRGDSRYRQ